MDNNNQLADFYDKLKDSLKPSGNTPVVDDTVKPNILPKTDNLSSLINTPSGRVFRNKVIGERDKFKDGCHKRILLDIYIKTLPLDDDYKAGHMGDMKKDVDSFLGARKTTGLKYLTSAAESTKAPLLEYVIRSINLLGDKFMEDAMEELKDAAVKGTDPKVPDGEDEGKVEEQLVDVKSDIEYKTFIDNLKQKTINRIVDDVSRIITAKKEEKDMEFDSDGSAKAPEDTFAFDEPALKESAVTFALNHINRKLYKEGVDVTKDMQDSIIGAAIREATFNEIDKAFRLPEGNFKNYTSNLRFNKGSILTESYITESFITPNKQTKSE